MSKGLLFWLLMILWLLSMLSAWFWPGVRPYGVAGSGLLLFVLLALLGWKTFGPPVQG